MEITKEVLFNDKRTKSTSTLASIRTNTTWRYDIFGPNRLGKGAMLFTGPDGIRDHRVKVDVEPHRYIGENSMSLEGTSEVAYLWRAPYTMAHPRPKSQCAGEIGWSVPQLYSLDDYLKQRQQGAHIQLGDFRQALEDRHTHLFQNPWYPGPGECSRDSSQVMIPHPASALAGQARATLSDQSNNNNNNNNNRYLLSSTPTNYRRPKSAWSASTYQNEARRPSSCSASSQRYVAHHGHRTYQR